MKKFLIHLMDSLGRPWWNGIGAIVAILALLVTLVAIPSIREPVFALFVKQNYVNKTNAIARNTTVSTPIRIPTISSTSSPTEIPSPGSAMNIMQDFCTYIRQGNAEGAFSILTSEAQHSYYQGNVQQFWNDFGEYSNGACTVNACNDAVCDVALSSNMHPSCQDSFTFVDLT